jgi:hypothetical protein
VRPWRRWRLKHSTEEVAPAIVGRHGGARWGSGGGVARCPFSGRRHVIEERNGRGVWSVCGHVKEEGGLATACAQARGPGHERVQSGGGSLRTAAPDRARGRQGKREREGRGRWRPMSGDDLRWGPANRGKGVGDRWGWLQWRWFKLNQTEPNQFERI